MAKPRKPSNYAEYMASLPTGMQGKFQEAFARTRRQQVLRSPEWQMQAVQLVQRFPWLRGLAQPGDTAGSLVLRQFQRLADPAQTAECLRDFGMDPGMSRREMLAEVCRATGIGQTAAELERTVLAEAAQIEMSDKVAQNLFERDVKQYKGDGPKLSPSEQAKAADRQSLRAVVENAYNAAERAEAAQKHPALRRHERAYKPGNDLQVDVERAYAAHAGQRSNIDERSSGLKMWQRKHSNPAERELSDIAHESIRARVEAEGRDAALYQQIQQASPEEAEAVGAWAAETYPEGGHNE